MAPQKPMYMSLDDASHKAPNPTLPFVPPSVFHFDALFIRILYHRMGQMGYANQANGGVHVSVFRRCMRRLLDLFDSEINFDYEAFGGHRKAVWLKWEDIRQALEDGRLPEIELNMPERVFMVLNGKTNSLCGIVWTCMMFVAIISNVVMIVVQSIPDYCEPNFFYVPCGTFMDALTMIFSVDYFGKLACAPFCRHAIFNDDWLIDHVIVDPQDPNTPPPSQASPWERLSGFVFQPLNLVDLISVLPYWINVLFGFMNLKAGFGFLRSLRLLRLFRLMKFGKFSKTLLVLGDTFRKSSQSICVLILYILMISLLAGAVINRFEQGEPEGGEGGLFATVPSSLWWVVTRMVSMHSSLPGAKGYPSNPVSAIVVTWVGMFKGVIFVLPIGQITTAFKEAWNNQQENDLLQKQIEKERTLPLGSEWSKEATAPTGRLELFHFLEGGGVRDLDAYGTLPLPIFSQTDADSTLWVPLRGTDMWTFFRDNAYLQVQLVWKPDVEDGKYMLPQGQLLVRLLQGSGFPNAGGSRWGVKTTIPTGLFGSEAYEFFITPPSSSGVSPTWEEGACQSFEIRWAENIDGPKPSPHPPPPDAMLVKQEEFQRKVLQLLEGQALRIHHLEQTLLEVKTAAIANLVK